jgi:hypothetical protein
MKRLTLSRKWLLLVPIVAIATGITVGVFSAKRQVSKQQKRVTELPEVKSHVPRLKVVGVSIKDPGTPAARAVVEIFNNSLLAVMAVEISTKNRGDSGAVNIDGLTDPGNPIVVIEPWGRTTLEMNFGEMIPDAPLVISAAIFEDGTEEGDKWSLDAMKGSRAKRLQQIKDAQGRRTP